jgi:hypothetical protein
LGGELILESGLEAASVDVEGRALHRHFLQHSDKLRRDLGVALVIVEVDFLGEEGLIFRVLDFALKIKHKHFLAAKVFVDNLSSDTLIELHVLRLKLCLRRLEFLLFDCLLFLALRRRRFVYPIDTH